MQVEDHISDLEHVEYRELFHPRHCLRWSTTRFVYQMSHDFHTRTVANKVIGGWKNLHRRQSTLMKPKQSAECHKTCCLGTRLCTLVISYKVQGSALVLYHVLRSKKLESCFPQNLCRQLVNDQFITSLQ